ncbi:MAG TPA: MmcQ/YjbR family DNA-binding protein [Telluria sp.]|nr:MmcQ/YjbR family DNA-binding protein [Telluria sp.]
MKLDAAREYALSLPEASEEPHVDVASFRVRGKIFATVPPAGTRLHIFVGEALRAPLIAAAPETYQALHWGAKVVAVMLAAADGATVKHLLRESWRAKAPKRLAASLAPGQD